MSTSARLQSQGLLLATALALVSLPACSPEPEVAGHEPSMRQLSEPQYRNIIEDVFGSHIIVSSNFNPIFRKDGLVAVGAANTTVSASSFAKYEKLAHSIAEQILNERNRASYVQCAPAAQNAADDACARAFLERVGRLLFRRPLSESELSQTVGLAANAARELSSFYQGLAFGLASLLVSPNFLFIADDVAPAGEKAADDSSIQLTAYAKASRLSFFLWNTTPDSELLDAAEAGVLATREGLETQVTRMMHSPKLRDGVRAFFTDALHLEEFEHLKKDNVIYPAFDPEVREDAKEQLLRTITYRLLDEDGDYRELFSIRKTFMNGPLGRIYRVPVPEPDVWTLHEFSNRDARSGIQSLAGFVALHSHPGRSSPTIRGKAVREILLCQSIPDPPGDVDFTQFNSTLEQKTARERLKVHNSVDSCAGCHKITDGIGLSLENFDGAGQFRSMDAGLVIDASGELDGVEYPGPAGFAQALSDNPAVPDCLVQRVLAYSLARTVKRKDKPWLEFLSEGFADRGYRLKPLMRSIATSNNFFAVAPPVDQQNAPTRVGSR